MNILDKFYSFSPKNEKFYPRKLKLPKNESFILTGPRGSGKSALIFNYLQNLNKNDYLYIDCLDPLFILEELQSDILEDFIRQENIKTLILDHFYEGFLETFPKVEHLIIVSKDLINLNLKKYFLFPLDFEEFINFEPHLSQASVFTQFSKKGSLPKIAISNNYQIAQKEFFFEKFDAQEGKVMLILSLFQAKITTPHQIYQKAKDYFKISKDWLYKTIKNYEKEGVIFQIPTLNKGFGKKLIIYDFAFSNYLNKYQTFLTTLDSIIAIALIKKRKNIVASNLPLGYLMQNEFILIAPFDSEESFWIKAQNNFGFFTKNKIKKITVITVSNSFEFNIKNISFSALPFYEWVVGL
jgi:predicted AAA+ superfamily ATPase